MILRGNNKLRKYLHIYKNSTGKVRVCYLNQYFPYLLLDQHGRDFHSGLLNSRKLGSHPQNTDGGLSPGRRFQHFSLGLTPLLLKQSLRKCGREGREFLLILNPLLWNGRSTLKYGMLRILVPSSCSLSFWDFHLMPGQASQKDYKLLPTSNCSSP